MRRIDFLSRGLSRSSRVLELGAGTGLQTEELVRRIDDVVGIDISPDLLDVARKRVARALVLEREWDEGRAAKPRAQLFVMDAHTPDFEPESFEAVLGVSILHHLDWEQALAAAYTLLKPGGVIRFSEPNLVNPQIYIQKKVPFVKRLAGDSPDEHAFTRWQIRASLERTGFTGINVQPFEFLHPSTPRTWIPLVTRLEAILSRTPLVEIAGSLLIEARKVKSRVAAS